MIVGIGFFQMKISDTLIIFIVAMILTVQLPFWPSMFYYVVPMVILDYFSKSVKYHLTNDDKYDILIA